MKDGIGVVGWRKRVPIFGKLCRKDGIARENTRRGARFDVLGLIQHHEWPTVSIALTSKSGMKCHGLMLDL
jgi:hypothetical protein